jgi:hypothetical protein
MGPTVHGYIPKTIKPILILDLDQTLIFATRKAVAGQSPSSMFADTNG